MHISVLIIRNKFVWIIAAAYACTGAVRHSSDQLSVMFFTEQLGIDLKSKPLSVIITLNLMTAAAILGSIASGWISDRFFQSRRAPVAMARFRPNIVLSGLQAHDEDRLTWLSLATPSGPVRLKLVKPCPRCPIPNIDPSTALSHPAVGDALQAYRPDARVGGAVTFGMNAIVCEGDGVALSVGQSLQGEIDFG